MCKFKLGEVYTTRDGRKARILSRHENQELCFIGEYEVKPNKWVPRSWTREGSYKVVEESRSDRDWETQFLIFMTR